VCPPPFYLSVKLNSSDYMVEGWVDDRSGAGAGEVAAGVWDGGFRGDIGWDCRAVYFQVA
jgi:hypothetical protein